jgi:molybdopterin-guanine dinucleotide biosynthesis protein A
MRENGSFHKITSAILAGGQSSRMGQPKEGVVMWDGRPMMAHMLDVLRPISSKIVIIGKCNGFSVPNEPNIIHLQDRHPGHGPLSALDALLASDLAHRYLVVSCDQPLLNPKLLNQLVSTVGGFAFFRTKSGIRLDPFPGIYPSWLLSAVESALNHRALSIRDLINRHAPRWITLPEQTLSHFANVNTPDALIAVGEYMQKLGLHYNEPVVN